MNTTLWAVIGGAIFTVLVAFGGYRAGTATAGLECAGERAAAVDKIITQDKIIIREVPKIITKYIQTTTTVENTYHDSTVLVPNLFDSSCIMPSWWGELFVNAANGVSNDPRTAGKAPGVYGCIETAKATLGDLKAGTANSAQAAGIQQWAQLLNKGDGK